jgi:hypothetical protein
MHFLLCCLSLVWLLSPAPALADEGNYYIGARSGTDVLNAPKSSAKVIAHLPRKTDVKIVRKQRSWWKIQVLPSESQISLKPQVTGWVHAGAVRKRYQASAFKKKKSSFMSKFASLFHRSAPRNQTAVLGVRGLEDKGARISLQSGHTSQEMVRWMESLGVSDEEVSGFIEEGDLNP